MNSYCPNCGNIIEEDKRFCSKCGKKMPLNQNNDKLHKLQILQLIVQIIILMVIASSFYLLFFMDTNINNFNLESMFENEGFLFLNIITVFIPALFVILITFTGGWFILGVDIILLSISSVFIINGNTRTKIISIIIDILLVFNIFYAFIVCAKLL